MGTAEQTTLEVKFTTTHNTTTTTATTTAAAEPQQQQQQQQQHMQLPKASPPPQVIIIPATQASTMATNAAKKIRRAFSMPRNPFRWSRKFKTTATGSESSVGGSNSAITSCVGGGRGRAGSIVSLSSYEAVCKDTSGNMQRQQQQQMKPKQQENTSNNSNSNNNKLADNITENAKMVGKHSKQVSSVVDAGINGGVGGVGGGSGAIGSSSNNNRTLRRSSFRKFLSRMAQQLSATINVGANKHASATQTSVISTTDRVPPISGYQWPADQTPGVMGLKNHGNTCFMNAVLQCLSHTDILAEYFVLDQYKVDLKRRNKINSRKFGTKGELTEQLANVLKALWTCKNESEHSTSFKAVVDRYGSQFRSSTQHDAQEFLFWLLDKVHEDLNTATKRRYKSVKNSYGRPDEVIAAETLANHIRCNNSFVQAVFQAQFRSSLTCPRCRKQSNTFDPFHCISVQLPQLTQQTIFVTVVYLKKHPRQVKLGLVVPAGSPIVALRDQLQTDTGIASDHMVLVDINREGFTRVFYDTQPVSTLNGIETIYCIEVPELKTQTATATATVTANVATPTSSTANESIAASTATAANATKNTIAGGPSNAAAASDLLLLIANVRKKKKEVVDETAEDGGGHVGFNIERFGTPFSMQAPRDCSYIELQKKLMREMSPLLKPEVFSYATPLADMFQIRLQDPSADPDTYLEQVEHPLLTEMIDLALSVLSAEAGPAHIKLLLEWTEPEQYFNDLTDTVVEHESVARLIASKPNDTVALTLEQCLEHYTKAETLSAEDAWRCPHCQQYLPVVKTLGLWSLPDILVVHFKRFRQHHEKGANAAKLTTMVKFPLNAFDMSPHLARGIDEETPQASFTNNTVNGETSLSSLYRPSPWKKVRTGDSRSSTLNSRDNKETRYDLYAVCYHQGDTLETGHYTAACKNPYDRQWYKFDDQRVSRVPNETMHDEIINNEAYMLFYQRRLGDAAECSGSSSNSGDHWVSRIAPPTAVTTNATTSEEKVNARNIANSESTSKEEPLENASTKAETKPVEIPKINDARVDVKQTSTISIVAPNETLAQKVVINQVNEQNLADIDKIDYADVNADIVEEIVHKGVIVINGNSDNNNDHDDDDDDDELIALANKNIAATTAEDANRIFVMDEDCQIHESSQNAQTSANDMKTALLIPEAATNSMIVNKKLSPLLTTTATIETALTNGHKNEKTKSSNVSISSTHTAAAAAAVAQRDIKNSMHSNSSTDSSTSSLSSRSSPHSLAVSIHGASTLQSKFNGFSASSSSANNYKEVLLSSSLKSNSSSIINGGGSVIAATGSNGAVAVPTAALQAHEFQLSRHHQHQHWNGSRLSVSAVENATHQTHQHAHCLNLRHSFSTSSNYKLRECSETLSSMLRNSANTCSKDTLLFIDQQTHHHHNSLMEDDDDTFMGSRSLWISPVTPHKLITVSPKN